jgi:ABC-type nitrate/sulfonate/bicarbonate transport system ATPase subunit
MYLLLGVSSKEMHTYFRGEAIFAGENDVHFPMLSVRDTLSFAAHARAPRELPAGLKAEEFSMLMRDVIMAIFGISHTANTVVGNDFVRGISGGERKRVSIAEASLSDAALQCWDNSTRGLDSANAVEFCRTLRTATEFLQSTVLVSLYQAPQEAYYVSPQDLPQLSTRAIGEKHACSPCGSFSIRSRSCMKDGRFSSDRHLKHAHILKSWVLSVRFHKIMIPCSACLFLT